MVNFQIIITFTCRLRRTLISHFEIKVRIIQIIVYIEETSTLSKYYSGHVRPGQLVLL